MEPFHDFQHLDWMRHTSRRWDAKSSGILRSHHLRYARLQSEAPVSTCLTGSFSPPSLFITLAALTSCFNRFESGKDKGAGQPLEVFGSLLVIILVSSLMNTATK